MDTTSAGTNDTRTPAVAPYERYAAIFIHPGNATAGVRSVHVAAKAGTTETQLLRLATAGHSDREESKK